MPFPKVQGETDAEHIGDGVYATYDGYHVWLRTERDGVWESIALDPYTWDNLIQFRKRTLERESETVSS